VPLHVGRQVVRRSIGLVLVERRFDERANDLLVFLKGVLGSHCAFLVDVERLSRSNYYGQLFSGMRAFPHTWRKELVHFLCHEYRELLWKSQCTSGDIALHTLLHIWGPIRNCSECDRTHGMRNEM
jgi:hypothetical protein